MVSSHTAVAIAQTVFYAPVLPITVYLLIRNWKAGPRLAWYPLVLFCLMRLAGGITVIIWSTDVNNLGLIIASIVLLNLGLIPLIVTINALTRFVIASSFPDDVWGLRIGRILRFAILVAIGLLIAAGSLIGNARLVDTQRTLTKVGYVEFVVILCVLVVMLLRLQIRQKDIKIQDFIYVKLTLITTPFIMLRAIFGLLYAFTSHDVFSMWNPLFGSALAFGLIALLPEYIALVTYIYLGFYRIRTARQYAASHKESAT
ncbi:hypothetical protein PFICI_15000 [Pestalotiopsis fici W106-1]|uniref:DUF7702 domain-containing protein n=1 Tax=Pestalotiopsis fici (strain W106-1 / CGMCC3.15140) TaxID=1229662 RepID=W3WHJ0_PESFW|nr:uncharacterized protein PFICI_15000 [Pestalotiopsis fici W106-1]ETS73395.1 hypothetical protein PFICI_15000 [Pestalotiopsis fici W106-1]